MGSEEQHREDIRGKTSSAIYSHPDIPRFLLLDASVNELFLPAGLGAHRVLILDWRQVGN
jgi:hypothetical protein